MNVSFFIDDTFAHIFTHQGSSAHPSSLFASSVNVFSQTGLTDGPHTLELSLAPNSVFILDSIVVTQNPSSAAPEAWSAVSSPTGGPSAGGASAPSQSDKKGRVSFAGVLAGVLGVLGTLCAGVAISLICRRRRAAARDRREREGMPPPPAQPMAFVPRYFPGTVVAPSTLPPYTPSDARSTMQEGEDLDGDGEEQTERTDPMRSYADIPPPLDELAPPAFGVAITLPAVPLEALPQGAPDTTGTVPVARCGALTSSNVPSHIALPASPPVSQTADGYNP
ncbi:hypothetical protein GGX14DRAFT_428122 [Mycena pura]|uniref:Transmembrane protein n=1 Tax=Mycena pura TaxID=153505 RepID=A0AAD6VVC4_9AGAR|nr:hypothetical protein GGX14DRAFT_428122 [Mycena pura]